MDAKFYELIEGVLPSRWHRFVRAEKGKRYESIGHLLRKQGRVYSVTAAAVKAFSSPSILDKLRVQDDELIASAARRWNGGLGVGRAASGQRF